MQSPRLSPQLLREARIKAGLSRNGLARKAGVSGACVSRIENADAPGGRAGRPETWAKLADALERPLADLLTEDAA